MYSCFMELTELHISNLAGRQEAEKYWAIDKENYHQIFGTDALQVKLTRNCHVTQKPYMIVSNS